MIELKKILHIEDDPDIQAVTKLALELFGEFLVEQSSSGRDGLEKASIFLPDLILLDVMMPEMDGPETLHELRKLDNSEHTQIIFMTAKAEASDITKLKELGAIGVICKPFDPMELPNQIRDIWNGIEQIK